MSDRFVVCVGCSRHVKAFERSCPFCKGDLASARASTGDPFRRMAAAAAVAAGVATIVGCGSNPGPSTFNGTGEDAAGDVKPPMFTSDAQPGVPPGDGGQSGTDAASDAPMAVAFYGIANPLDGGGSG